MNKSFNNLISSIVCIAVVGGLLGYGYSALYEWRSVRAPATSSGTPLNGDISSLVDSNSQETGVLDMLMGPLGNENHAEFQSGAFHVLGWDSELTTGNSFLRNAEKDDFFPKTGG